MLTNIIDHRKHPYCWETVDVIVEPAWHDNLVAPEANGNKYSDLVPRVWGDDDDIGYFEQFSISITEAVKWAQAFPYPVTLFIYDVGGNKFRTVPPERHIDVRPFN